MKTLSIQQPWASLLAEQVKTIELRGWSTKYRGTILVRASRNAIPWYDDTDTKVKLPTECLLFVGELVDIQPMLPEHRLPAMSIFWNEDFAWTIRFNHYVFPTQAAGKMKLYDTDDDKIIELPDSEIRRFHPLLKSRSKHSFRAYVAGGEIIVVDSRTGEQTYYTTHLDHVSPLAWVLVPMFSYIGGLRGGDTPITWNEVASVVNEGMCYQRIEDLPLRQL